MADKEVPLALKFAFGGISGCGAVCVAQPMDLVKNRMQVSGEGGGARLYNNSLHCAQTIIKTEGFFGLYSGLTASFARQLSYTTVRLGVYQTLLERFSTDGETPGFAQKTALGMTAGSIGAFFGTPADVALVRMTVDKRLPVAERRNYSSVLDAWAKIVRDEGITALWRGVLPTIYRAMIVNVCQLSVQTQAKEAIYAKFKVENKLALSFYGSMVAGFVTACVSLPVDMAKTRTQNMKIIDGKPEYKGMFDVIQRTVKSEGVPALWKGWTPYFARTAPITVVTLVLMDMFMDRYRKMN